MTGGVSNGGATLILWTVVAVPTAIAAGTVVDKASARWRSHLPAWWRECGWPCEGDQVSCWTCKQTAEAEAWPDDRGADGMALFCGSCGAVLDFGEGIV